MTGALAEEKVVERSVGDVLELPVALVEQDLEYPRRGSRSAAPDDAAD